MEVTPSKLQYSFEGKRVLITGGGRGVGYALVSRLYHDGAKVFTLEKDPELVSQLRKDFPDASRLRAEVCDISKWNETQALIKSFGPVNHLVNNAAIFFPSNLVDETEERVDLVLGVNLKSQFCTSQVVAKQMIAEGVRGTIVNLASILGSTAARGGFGTYSVAKAGVIMLTKCLATELGEFGIRVNSVSPTAMDTPMFKESSTTTGINDGTSIISRQPLRGRKVLEMDEIVNAVLFMLSPLSSMATGTDFVLDGGILAC